ncbi:MAG: hypothetical protein ACI4F7_11670 [Acutalibacteraceae bacterium]
MKYNKILLFFGITLPLCVLLRTLELFFTVETETGFFKNEFKSIGVYLLILIIAIAASLAIICFTGHRNPEHPPKTNPFMSAAAILTAFSIGAELYNESFSGTVMKWQLTLLMVTGLAAAVYFFLYGLTGFIDLRLPALASVIPALYLVMRIICSFTSISSLALISDNVLLLAAYCLLLLFFLSFGKLYCGIGAENEFRKLMAMGLTATVLCFTQAVPHIIINLATNNGYQHTSDTANFSLLMFGIFAAAFVFSHFSASNSLESGTQNGDVNENEKKEIP